MACLGHKALCGLPHPGSLPPVSQASYLTVTCRLSGAEGSCSCCICWKGRFTFCPHSKSSTTEAFFKKASSHFSIRRDRGHHRKGAKFKAILIMSKTTTTNLFLYYFFEILPHQQHVVVIFFYLLLPPFPPRSVIAFGVSNSKYVRSRASIPRKTQNTAISQEGITGQLTASFSQNFSSALLDPKEIFFANPPPLHTVRDPAIGDQAETKPKLAQTSPHPGPNNAIWPQIMSKMAGK